MMSVFPFKLWLGGLIPLYKQEGRDIFRAAVRPSQPVRGAMMKAKEAAGMVISGEVYIGVNLLMDLCCLAAAGRVCQVRAQPGRLLLSAAAGTGLSMAALGCWGVHAGVFAALPIALLMALLAFGLRAFSQGVTGLLISGLFTAGIASYLSGLGLNVWAAALCCLPAAWYALRLLLRWRSRAGERTELRLLFERGGVTLDGFIDSGNLLRDPITALPVVVAPYGALREHLPPDMECENLSTLPQGFRLICVRTAAGSQMLMCFRPRGLYIRCGRVWRAAQAVVAVSPRLRGRCALLPPTI